MLDVIHVKKSIDGKLVLKDVSFQAKTGSIFGLVGENGAGKSTLLRVIAGILTPDYGTILLGTETVFDNLYAKKNIFFVPDEPYYIFNQTIKQLISFYEAFYKIDHEYLGYLLNLFELNYKDVVQKLSKGKRKRVYIALGLAIHPKLLLLDETFDGLDPKAKKIFKEETQKLVKKYEMTIVLASHSLRELTSFSSTYGFLNDGELILIESKAVLEKPIYRVLVLNENDFDCENLHVLKKVVEDNYLILDIYANEEVIKQVFKDRAYNISLVPFDDWIVYQMEELA